MICSVTQTLPSTQRRSPAYCNKIDLLHSFVSVLEQKLLDTLKKTTRQMYFKAGGVTKKTVIVPFQDVPGDYFLGRQLFDLTYVPLSVVLAGDLAQETLR